MWSKISTTPSGAKTQLSHSEIVGVVEERWKCIAIPTCGRENEGEQQTRCSLNSIIIGWLYIDGWAIKPDYEAPGPWIVPKDVIKLQRGI